MNSIQKAFLSLFLFAPSIAIACEANYYNGKAPQVNGGLAKDGYEVCYDAYNVFASGVTKTGIFSAEKLTKENLYKAKKLKRDNDFHPEPSIPPEHRAEIEDYKRSGYDRGHMAPNGDMPTKQAQRQSFSLANMIPQDPELNRGIWAGIESSVRDYAKEHGEVYVVTGASFTPDKNGDYDALNGRVIIPSHLWKAVFNPSTQDAAVYWVPNKNVANYEMISIAELERRSGVSPFANLSNEIKKRVGRLPAATSQAKTDKYRVYEKQAKDVIKFFAR